MSSELNFADVNDFSDLEASFRFKCLGNTYNIPPISKKKALELVDISKVAMKTAEESSESDSESTDTESSDFQDKFLVSAVKKESVSETGEISLIDLTIEEVQDWPIQLQLKIVNIITKIISTDVTKEKKD